jgi:hypothetical protein
MKRTTAVNRGASPSSAVGHQSTPEVAWPAGKASEPATKRRREETDAECVRGCLVDVTAREGRGGLMWFLTRAALKAVDKLSRR